MLIPFLIIFLVGGIVWYLLVNVIHDPKVKVHRRFEDMLPSGVGADIRIMGIFPHPDDECMALGGILTRASQQHCSTYVLCLTKGEAGESPLVPGKDLGTVREKEFYCSCSVLGVSKSQCLNFPDGDLSSHLQAITERIEKEISDFKPSIVFTYDPTGMDGHPDHVATSKAVTQAISSYRFDKRRNVDIAVPVLYYYVEPDNLLREYFAMNKETIADMPKPTIAFDVRGTWKNRWQAVDCHNTQLELKNIFVFPSWLVFLVLYKEYFAQAPVSDQ